MAEYANPDALVETDWLAQHLDDPAIRVIEVDEDTTAYGKGHIKNALAWGTGTQTCTQLLAGSTSTRRGSHSSYGTRGRVPTRRSCSTGATTTGSPPTRTGWFDTWASAP